MSKTNSNLLKGKIITNIKNSYILINKLGSGSYATVWSCYATNIKNLMAIKIFKTGEHNAGKKEIETYDNFNKLGIKHTVKMHDSFIQNNNVYIVIDLMFGSLYDIMKKYVCSDNRRFNNGYPIEFITKIIPSLLEALNDLHKNNIIHGDIKPENILLYGMTIEHQNLLQKISMKSSVKKISDLIKLEMKNIDIADTSESDTDITDTDLSDSELSKNETLCSITDCSPMSNDPEPIILYDSDTYSDSYNSDDEEKKISNNLVIPLKYIENPIIKLSDLGACVYVDSKNKPNSIQTKYYRAPEIIIGLDYGIESDLWALGCTLYELVTSEILFNPDDSDVDDKRYILSKIYNKIGELPKYLIDGSPLKQVFFTDNYTLKTNIYEEKDNKNIFLQLCEKGINLKSIYTICILLSPDPYGRHL